MWVARRYVELDNIKQREGKAGSKPQTGLSPIVLLSSLSYVSFDRAHTVVQTIFFCFTRRLLGELNGLGWKLTSSADISAKYLTTKKERTESLFVK